MSNVFEKQHSKQEGVNAIQLGENWWKPAETICTTREVESGVTGDMDR